jgi:hypothetical protein
LKVKVYLPVVMRGLEVLVGAREARLERLRKRCKILRLLLRLEFLSLSVHEDHSLILWDKLGCTHRHTGVDYLPRKLTRMYTWLLRGLITLILTLRLVF